MEMTTDDRDIVSALRTALAAKVGKERFDMWFGPRTRIDWDGQVLVIGAPNQFFLDWIRGNFRTAIEEACLAILGRRPALEFRVEVAGQNGGAAPTQTGQPVDCRPATQSGAEAMVSCNGKGKHDPAREAEVGDAARACGVAKQAEPPPTPAFSPRKFASLSSFVVGAATGWPCIPPRWSPATRGKSRRCSCTVPTSVGKTHLLEGIWSAERKAGRGTTTVYLSAEQFTSQFLEALRGGGLPVFRRKYRAVNVLIIDDLQFLAGKRATQVEMMHTVDTLLREGRQLVFAADRPPVEFNDFMPELTTRLTSGMICRIEPPDYVTRLGIVGHMSRGWGSNCLPTCSASWPRG